MRTFGTALLAALVVTVAMPAAAAGSCVAGVVVDGRFLVGAQTGTRSLPASGAPYPAVFPACNDTGGPREPDEAGKVIRFRGIPPHVAVLSSDKAMLYVAQGALTGLEQHPLHLLAPRSGGPRTCRPGPLLIGAASHVSGDRLRISERRGEHLVRIDSRSRLVNRPAIEVVHIGQRLRISTRRCGRRLVADGIAFRGATKQPAPFEAYTPEDPLPWPYIGLGVAWVGFAAVLRVRRPPGAAAWATFGGALILAAAAVVFVIGART